MTKVKGDDELDRIIDCMKKIIFEKEDEEMLLNLLKEVAPPNKIDTFIEAKLDRFIEVISGFIYERCDNLLANVKERDLRDKILDIAKESYDLYFEAFCSNRGVEKEGEIKSLISSRDEFKKAVNQLEKLLGTGLFDIMIVPKRWSGLFFKQYYKPKSQDMKKLINTSTGLRNIINVIIKSKNVKAKYGDRLIKIRDMLNAIVETRSLREYI